MSIVYESNGSKHEQLGDSDGRAIISVGKAVHSLYQATLNISAVAASTPYVLVDLTDTTNFPHSNDANIWLKKLIIDGEKDSDARYDIKVGVVTDIDATNGDVDWIYVAHLEHVANVTDSTDRFYLDPDWCTGGDPRGIDLTITDDAWVNGVTNISDTASTDWQTDESLTCPAGTCAPGAGDLVARIESQAGPIGTIDATITAFYYTE